MSSAEVRDPAEQAAQADPTPDTPAALEPPSPRSGQVVEGQPVAGGSQEGFEDEVPAFFVATPASALCSPPGQRMRRRATPAGRYMCACAPCAGAAECPS